MNRSNLYSWSCSIKNDQLEVPNFGLVAMGNLTSLVLLFAGKLEWPKIMNLKFPAKIWKIGNRGHKVLPPNMMGKFCNPLYLMPYFAIFPFYDSVSLFIGLNKLSTMYVIF